MTIFIDVFFCPPATKILRPPDATIAPNGELGTGEGERTSSCRAGLL